ncbi:MAG: DUF354 domain-containing protein, partial [Nitrososphaerota archaeon]
MRKIWLDILTPKQFWLFTNVADRLRSLGFHTLLTTREYEQVTPLLKASGRDDIIVVGEYGGGSLYGKLRKSLERAVKLLNIVEAERPAACISFGSPEASRIAYGLGIPHILVSDTPDSPVNRLAAPISTLIMTPWVINKSVWRRYGVPGGRVRLYRGLDPIAWLNRFSPDRSVLESHGLVERRYVLVRSPEYKAAYLTGRFDLDRYVRFCRGLLYVCSGYDVVLLPRYSDEVEYLRNRLGEDVTIISQPVYGPSIIYYSAVLVGGGGTMTQEAALLGIPNISFYPSQLPRPIKFLSNRGLVVVAEGLEEAIKAVGEMLAALPVLRTRLSRIASALVKGM